MSKPQAHDTVAMEVVLLHDECNDIISTPWQRDGELCKSFMDQSISGKGSLLV